ncbi:transposon Tf2-11 polyprotein [Trichonephila clavipes]|nr:transposon Tf2-11 polyprotein [Trichonephila clavipes]
MLEGLTDGLPINLRQLLTISPPSNPTEWIIVIENRCELREILSHYDSIFSKDKYDVDQLRVEPQRIIIKSDLPVHLRPYRTSPFQEKEIKGQVEKLLLKLLNQAHEQFGHTGVQKMLNLISLQYYWPNITTDISEFVKHCTVCQLNKKRKQKKFELLQQVPPTSKPFEFISVDTLSVGGFNYYNSTKKNLRIVIDHATRCVWAFPSKNENSETYANILKQVFKIQITEKLLIDRKDAFTSSRFKKFLRNYYIKHLLTTAHHPQTNGKNERVNQSLVTRLKCKVNASSTKIPWTKLLDQVCNENSSTPHSITKYPPAYLLFGLLPYQSSIDQNNYYEPVHEARELALQRTIDYHIKNKIRYDACCIEKNFNPGDPVVYEEFQYPNTRKLSSPFSVPYEIIKQCSRKSLMKLINQILGQRKILKLSIFLN